MSRRFVAKTAAQLTAWQSQPLDTLDLVALLIDGVQVAEHCIVVALGIDKTGRKHALGLWDGSTENATVCQSLLANLQSRGLRTDRSVLVILDGSTMSLSSACNNSDVSFPVSMAAPRHNGCQSQRRRSGDGRLRGPRS